MTIFVEFFIWKQTYSFCVWRGRFRCLLDFVEGGSRGKSVYGNVDIFDAFTRARMWCTSSLLSAEFLAEPVKPFVKTASVCCAASLNEPLAVVHFVQMEHFRHLVHGLGSWKVLLVRETSTTASRSSSSCI